jgi:hypothetical protein
VVATWKRRTAPAAGARWIAVDGPPTRETFPVMIGRAFAPTGVVML